MAKGKLNILKNAAGFAIKTGNMMIASIIVVAMPTMMESMTYATALFIQCSWSCGSFSNLTTNELSDATSSFTAVPQFGQNFESSGSFSPHFEQ